MVGIQQIAKYGRLSGLVSCGIFRLCAISVLRAQVVGDQSQPKPQLVRFKKELEKLVPGDPMDPKTTLGPLCTSGALELIQKQIKTAVDSGAKVSLGGKRLDRPGYFLQPTILTNITPENPAFHQEFFAPVALFSASKTKRRRSTWQMILLMGLVDQ